MWIGIAVLAALAAIIAAALLISSAQLPQSDATPAQQINALLPQSQCAQCGFPGCRPYAEAIVRGDADIDQCAPGGDALVTALAKLLGRNTKSVNPAYGVPGPLLVARINEEACIGCAICLAACPVDAIVGAARYTHTILRDECTGCELCIEPCPVDCIVIERLLPT
jgi:electron transport complex protein RnfB